MEKLLAGSILLQEMRALLALSEWKSVERFRTRDPRSSCCFASVYTGAVLIRRLVLKTNAIEAWRRPYWACRTSVSFSAFASSTALPRPQ